MASTPDAVDRFEREQVFVASVALTVRRLREAAPEMLPQSNRGGGRESPQMEPHHLRRLILAQAAHLPVDAAAAVVALQDLPMTAYGKSVQIEPDIDDSFPAGTIPLRAMKDQTIGEVLDYWICSLGDPVVREVIPSVTGDEWILTLCADPPFAVISQRWGKTTETATFGERLTNDRAQRLINLPLRVLLIAGELFQNTYERRTAALLPHTDERPDDEKRAAGD